MDDNFSSRVKDVISYSKEEAFYPLGRETKKFWQTSNRVDDLYGDKLFYSKK